MNDKIILLSVHESGKTEIEKPIIGTDSLVSCSGILLLCEETKEAFVGHYCMNFKKDLNLLYKLIKDYKGKKLKSYIFNGFDYHSGDHMESYEDFNRRIIKEFKFLNSIGFKIDDPIINPINFTIKDNESYGFLFNVETWKFLSEQDYNNYLNKGGRSLK